MPLNIIKLPLPSPSLKCLWRFLSPLFLMVALAPVMTKRMNENIKVNGLGETYKAPADMQCFHIMMLKLL